MARERFSHVKLAVFTEDETLGFISAELLVRLVKSSVMMMMRIMMTKCSEDTVKYSGLCLGKLVQKMKLRAA